MMTPDYSRNPNRPRRLAPGSTKEERRAHHKKQMEQRRDYYRVVQADMIRHKTTASAPFANISRFHPDWGDTPAEHAAKKLQRAAGKLKFQPKAQLRARRLGLARSYGL